MQVVWSDYIQGVGLHAGGPYGDYASFGNKPKLSEVVEKSVDLADKLSAERKIDNTRNLQGLPVFIQSGTREE